MPRFLNFNLSPPLCYSLKRTNFGLREKKIFCICFIFCIYTSAYHVISKEVENRVSCISRHTCMYEKPIFTKQGNYNNFAQILYSYFRYTDRLLNVFFLLLTVILSELHANPRRKDWVTEKNCIEEYVWGASLF